MAGVIGLPSGPGFPRKENHISHPLAKQNGIFDT
jgi:hypothetical protein